MKKHILCLFLETFHNLFTIEQILFYNDDI